MRTQSTGFKNQLSIGLTEVIPYFPFFSERYTVLQIFHEPKIMVCSFQLTGSQKEKKNGFKFNRPTTDKVLLFLPSFSFFLFFGRFVSQR